MTAATPIDLFASPSFSPRWASLPPRLRPVVRRATAYEPTARYPSAAAMAIDLRAALIAEDAEFEHTDEVPYAPPDVAVYAELARDPTTASLTLHGLSTNPYAIAAVVRVQERDAQRALPLTLAPLLAGLGAWFVAPVLLDQGPAAPPPLPEVVVIAAPPPVETAVAAVIPAELDTPPAGGTRTPRVRPRPTTIPTTPTLDELPPGLVPAPVTNGKGQDPEQLPPDVAAVAGVWVGRLGDIPASLQLGGRPSAMQGQLSLYEGDVRHNLPVSATWAPERGELAVELEDPAIWLEVDVQTISLRLDRAAERLSGAAAVAGQQRALALRRPL